ncbi:myocardial zonula adherens protein isoform X3 [Hypomesus transpacificus]|uniref:myocardial zonula adherens protein isoform X3 n=1 Tax=Hypomesus transpacificus TaxID=137520 RepID=UPI001F0811FD|nr:myocardial zonula adherens protein isoform X3 [Hypomesus transpacificus]
MLRYGSSRVVTSTTTDDSPDLSSERMIRRLRLTLHSGGNELKETKSTHSDSDQEVGGEKEKVVNGTRKKNGLIQRERPAGRESPEQALFQRETKAGQQELIYWVAETRHPRCTLHCCSHWSPTSSLDCSAAILEIPKPAQHLGAVTNGVQETPQQPGPKVYGVVQRTGSDKQQEVMACEWSVNHLRDEMRYIKEVRDSLEKVRERMYGQFGGMQQSMEKLSQEIRSANSQRRSLEAEVKVRTAAMESFDQMNSSLISSNIDLQKSLLENCQNRVHKRDEVRNLRSSCEKAEEKLREKERQLVAAEAENRTLKLQVETSQQNSSQVVQDVTARLQKQHEERLREEQRKHREEIENLQAQIDEYVKRLEEAERNAKILEAKIAERDQRISEVERLLDCMGQEKGHLQMKLQESEQRLHSLELTDKTNSSASKRSQQLEEEASELKERIKHLNDMVFCQQRKVKGMIEEVESLRTKVAQKDMFISELLDRIAIVECENNQLEDNLKYFVSVQSASREVIQTREIGVSCNLLPRPEAMRGDDEPDFQPPHVYPEFLPSPAQFQPRHSPAQPPSIQLLSRTHRPGPLPPSRLECSLLRYSPFEYSRSLQSSPPRSCGTLTSPTLSESAPLSPVQSGPDQAISDTASSEEKPPSGPPCSPARSSRIYTPFMRLMEITAKINIE